MKKRHPGLAPLMLLFPLSIVYGMAVKARFLFYSLGILKQEKLPCKVISVGNITAGGSGKTPVTIFLAKWLKENGLNVTVLSRGYKRKGGGWGGKTGIVSDNENILLDVERSGDEPYLMAERLKGVPVIVGKSRVKSALYASEKFLPHVIILDDGFQHVSLKRDIDIVLLNSTGSGYLLPLGPLREPVAGIKRADILMIKGNKDSTDAEGFKKPLFRFTYTPGVIHDSKGNRFDIKDLKGKSVLAFAGIANPDSFFETLKDCGAFIVKTMTFPDHHWYTVSDIEGIKKEAGDVSFAVTTEKDFVRLKGVKTPDIPLLAVGVEVDIEKNERFLELIKERLALPFPGRGIA